MRKAPDNSQALATCVARKTEIGTILARLTDLSAEHFNRAPDEICWGDVGTLVRYLEGLREVCNAVFHEGEHAD